MKIHKEGRKIVALAALITLGLAAGSYWLFALPQWMFCMACLLLLVLFTGVVLFFRSPKRQLSRDDRAIISPADGKVIMVGETIEEEVFDRAVQKLSIFMSPLNVHLNRVPADGKVVLYRYHPGKYLVAWHPKSSRLNERNTIVFETPGGIRFLVRQIAGMVARRIVCYCHEGKQVRQGEELGFIKFGSRVDLYIPLGSTIHVKPGDHVKGGITTLAHFPSSSKSRV